ncbi:hypothetical protein ALQ35_05713 [Pseudomonas fluorescens]|nr:hypothetical protein ALQ35_05713 [Pseudomonas fluorescens]
MRKTLLRFHAAALLSLRRLAQTDMQLAQRLGIHHARSLGHHVRSTLGFREGNHFTDRLGAGHQHHQTVQTERQATVRRCAVFQGVEQETKLLFLFRFVDAQQAEDRLLHLFAVDTDRTATQLSAIEHHVIGTGQSAGRVGFQFFRRALRRGERVVQGAEAAVVVLFEHREVDDPHRRPLARQQVQVVTELDAQCAQRFADDLGLVGAEEHDVAVDRANAIQDRVQVVQRDVFHDRRLQAINTVGAFVDLDIRQAFGTVDADELGVVVDLFARHARAAGYTQGSDTAFRVVGRAAEHLEVDCFELVGHVHQFQRNTQVWLVGTVAAHGFFEGHVREFAEFQIQHFLEQVADHLLGQAHDLFFIEEAGLDVDLGEFWLAVGTQVFVTEALGDLVVTVEASHHQQLLEQLWRLRQGEEGTGVGTARHQVVTRAFRGGPGQDRRFDVEEAVLVEEATDAGGHARTQTQLLGHFRATQVEEAVAQARFFANVGILVEWERRGFRLVQHFELVTQHFNCAGRHVGVHGTGRTQANLAGDLHNVLAAHTVGGGEAFGAVRIEHHLGQTITITDIEENHPAVVAATVNPSAKGDFLTIQGLVQLAAIVAAHHGSGFTSRNSKFGGGSPRHRTVKQGTDNAGACA